MKRTIISLSICFAICGIPSCTKEGKDGENNKSQISVTGKAVDITSESASITCWANIDREFLTIVTFGVECSENPNMSGSVYYSASSLNQDNSYDVNVVYLEHTTTYYYRSFVKYISSNNYEYGDIKQFTTTPSGPVFGKPEITVQGVAASCVFAVKDDGGASISSCCVYYSDKDISKLSENQIHSLSRFSGTYENNCVNATLSGLKEKTSYYIVAYAKNEYASSFSDIVTVITGVDHSSSKYAVDMGLSVKWASMNVGAETSTEHGNYYSWGETSSKKEYNGGNYKFYGDSGGLANLTKYCLKKEDGYNGFVDNKTTLDLEDDCAHINWGGTWRMPTIEEWRELSNNCTWTWYKNYNNSYVCGYLVKSNKNGNSIFLPKGGYYNSNGLSEYSDHGYYWSSTLNEKDSYCAMGLNFYSKGRNLINNTHVRPFGFSVRPVLQ